MQIVDCKWSQYGHWSSCSTSCGEGIKTKSRSVIQNAMNGGKECPGANEMVDACKLELCPGIHKKL